MIMLMIFIQQNNSLYANEQSSILLIYPEATEIVFLEHLYTYKLKISVSCPQKASAGTEINRYINKNYLIFIEKRICFIRNPFQTQKFHLFD